MADINLSKIAGSGSGIPQLAPDLTYPADRFTVNGTQYELITGIDASSGLTSLVSGTGKFIILLLETDATMAESNTAKLTIDGVVVWNASFTAATSQNSLLSSTTLGMSESYLVEDSFDFEYQTATDTSIDLRFLIRPIL